MSSTEEKIRYEKFLAKAKEISASKEKSLKFLQDAGIIGLDGQLTPQYR